MNLSFNGVNSNSFGIYIEDVIRPIVSSINSQTLSIPGKVGSFEINRGELEDIIIEVKCGVDFEGKNSRTEIRKIAAWLYTTTKGKLIFSDEDDKYYYARCVSKITPEDIISFNTFTIVFRCYPLAISLESKSLQFNISGTKTIQVLNEGTFFSEPIITFTSSIGCANIKVSHEYGIFEWKSTMASGNVLKADSESMQVTKNTLNALNYQTGQFVKLIEGINNITISNFYGKVKIDYQERWI